MKLFTKVYPLMMPEGCWKLLIKYLVWLDYRLYQEGKPMLNMPKLIGGIIAQHLLDRRDEIQAHFYGIQAEILRRGELPRFFSAAQLARIDTATAAEIPDLCRIGWRDRKRRAKGEAAKEKALRGASRRSAYALPRLAGGSNPLRGWLVGAAAGADDDEVLH